MFAIKKLWSAYLSYVFMTETQVELTENEAW
jgi:hypothetical protein